MCLGRGAVGKLAFPKFRARRAAILTADNCKFRSELFFLVIEYFIYAKSSKPRELISEGRNRPKATLSGGTAMPDLKPGRGISREPINLPE